MHAAFTWMRAQRITGLRRVSETDVKLNIFARAVRSFGLGYSVR